MIGEGNTAEEDTDSEMLSPDSNTESFYTCQTSNTVEDCIGRRCISTPSTCVHYHTSQDSSHSGENIWQQGEEENKGGDDSRDKVIVWSESSFLADSSGFSGDTIYMALTKPSANTFQFQDRAQEQLATCNGPLPPHILMAEVKLQEGKENIYPSGPATDEITTFKLKTLEGDKVGVGWMPSLRTVDCFDAAGRAFQIKPEEGMVTEQEKCGANTCTDERQTAVGTNPLTTEDTGKLKWGIRASYSNAFGDFT